MFKKLSDVIEYYKEYHLTDNKYKYRGNNLSYFDKLDLRDLRKYHVKSMLD